MPATRTLARTAALLGAVCLISVPLIPSARAQSDPISVYQAGGRAQGIGLQFAFTPSIFDPLLDLGLLHTEANITSQGTGAADAVAATIFPGSLVVGGAGCAGIPGPPWVQAYYPRPEGCPQRQEATYNRTQASNFNPSLDPVLNAILERVRVKQGHLLADTDLGFSRSLVELQDLAFAADQQGNPVVRIGTLLIESLARLDDDGVGHRVSVRAKDVDIVGFIHIGSIFSVAETSSDGIAASANGTLVMADATATVNGTPYRIIIDDEGIRVSDPELNRRQEIGIQEHIEEGLLSAGLEIIVGKPVEIVEETKAEASVGGLILAVKGAIPPVAVPQELAPVIGQVIQQIPTQCLSDFGAPLPLCFGAGALPGPGSAVRMSISIAGAGSLTVGENPSFIFDPGTGGDTGGTGFDPGLGSGPAPFDPGNDAAVPGTGPQQPVQQPAGPSQPPAPPLVGYIANMPAAALLWSGASLLVLALALAFGPSLRHAGPR